MNRFLSVRVPVVNDEFIDNVAKMLRYIDYKKTYWRGIAPPNHIEYEFGPLSEDAIETYKMQFRKLFVDIPDVYRSHCTFNVYDEQ